MNNKDWIIGDNVQFGNNIRINVTELFEIGDRSIIRDNALIEGRSIRIGREAWIDEYAHIGGGSCFDDSSLLNIGDFFHMGKYSHINTARRVDIGDEVGVGINTKIFSHGAYLSAWNGFPVQFEGVKIGSNVWLPNAWVNPGVTIGDNVVVAAMSLVNKDLPKGCLAGGIPVKILKENQYPRELTQSEKDEIINRIINDCNIICSYYDNKIVYVNNNEETVFDLSLRKIIGNANDVTEKMKNQLRRNGIRFRYLNKNGVYKKW